MMHERYKEGAILPYEDISSTSSDFISTLSALENFEVRRQRGQSELNVLGRPRSSLVVFHMKFSLPLSFLTPLIQLLCLMPYFSAAQPKILSWMLIVRSKSIRSRSLLRRRPAHGTRCEIEAPVNPTSKKPDADENSHGSTRFHGVISPVRLSDL